MPKPSKEYSMTRLKRIFQIAFSLALLAATGSAAPEKLIVFHAGSLSVPFKQIAAEFNAVYPEIEILLEPAGSRECARKISDLKRPCDVMASADSSVIDELLIPDHASWNIPFAANEMAIVYHAQSRRSSEINSNNWYEILMDKKIVFGRSDPDADPCGYRTIMTLQLAGEFYNDPAIPEKLLEKDLNCIRPKETDLLALLEANAIDYIFLYRSVAQQHGLKFLTLPDEINLKSNRLADHYAKASVKISGKKPGEFLVKTGAPMIYGITIPNNAPNPEAALKFVDFVLGEKGAAIMEACGQPGVVPSPSSTYIHIPEALKPYASEK
jgi:molybdate/tungstate transport system substrate-binding protein